MYFLRMRCPPIRNRAGLTLRATGYFVDCGCLVDKPNFRFVDVDKRFQLGQFGPRAGREFNPIYRSDRRKDQSGKYPNHANNQQKLEELKCWLSTTPGCIHNSFVFGDSLTSYQLVQGMQETRQRVFDLSQKP